MAHEVDGLHLYQHDGNSEARRHKAHKILAILKDHLNTDFEDYKLLDLGCSAGVIAHEMSRYFHRVVGVDTDWAALRDAAGRQRARGNLKFVLSNGLMTPFPNDSFDVLVCAQVYEHVVAQAQLVHEIWRLLKPGGVCFFSGPNRWAIMEEHYWLPFLSWLPRPLANGYMRWLKRGPVYDVYPRSKKELQRLLADFLICDYTMALLRDPERFSVSDETGWLRIGRHIPEGLLHIASALVPNYNWVLTKPK